MQVHWNMLTRMVRTVFAVVLLSISGLVSADDVFVTPAAHGTGVDGGPSSGWVVDGSFDSIIAGSVLYVMKSQGADPAQQIERRAVYEFALPAALNQPGVTITQAMLSVPVNNESWASGGDSLTAYGYSGDGQLNLADFAMTGQSIWNIPYFGGSSLDYFIGASAFIQSLLGNASHAGFVLAVNSWGTSLQIGAGATLSINYVVSQPPAVSPNVTILSPAPGAVYAAGSLVTFQATATDPQDGDLGGVIQWNSSLDGIIGNGAQASALLSVGAHTVTASVFDSNGNSGSASTAVTVQALVNTSPQVTIASPVNGAQLVAGAAVTLQGSANDAEQGAMSQSIQWMLDNTLLLGSGASLSATLTAGTHTITASVVDSGGLTGQSTITVNVAAPTSYCDARGSNAAYEWIETVSVGNQSNISGSNGGYGDFTTITPMTVTTGANSMTLTPGYQSGSYNEYWSVWVDLNRDSAYSADELLVSGNAVGALSRTLTVPPATPTGTTRMRVAMRFGGAPSACGTFSWGEVEDYTVNIVAGSGTPPPPTPISYCSSRGSSTNYEWISQTVIAGVARSSGNNLGYGDFTLEAPIPLARAASNTLTLTSGYSGTAYPEQWMVWVDFNQDGTFGNDDFVFASGVALATSGSFIVPATARPGQTRMRIAMKYGSVATPCEMFLYGEVEDYTVSIP